MESARIVVAECDAAERERLQEQLTRLGYETLPAADARAALKQADRGVDLVLLDLELPGELGLEMIQDLREASDEEAAVVVVTAFSTVQEAVDALRLGADYFLHKPVQDDELQVVIGRLLQRAQLRQEVSLLRNADHTSLDRIVGTSSAVVELKKLLARMAQSQGDTILITGESGTGKGLAAKVIHQLSDRAQRPFLPINCTVLPDTLLESELFGHEKGAFTGAAKLKRGLLESARGGTIQLDEIGELPLSLQPKLLSFLEERSFRRVGGVDPIRVNVRVVATTNCQLEEAVREGRFREDLYYRLNVLRLDLPPLRSRQEDVRPLAQHFFHEFNQEFARRLTGMTEGALHQLEQHDWPGNIRELRNAVERAVLLSLGDSLTEEDFQMVAPLTAPSSFVNLPPGGIDMEEVERELVRQALERTAGNRTQAGELLGMNRDQIRYRIDKFDLSQFLADDGE